MKKLKLYIAASLNGKIADADGGVDWLERIPNPDQSDYGYAGFYDGIDTTLQGYTTYKQIVDWGIEFPYLGKKNYVLTRNAHREPAPHVEFITTDPANFVRKLKQGNGKDIWLIGGGQVNALFLKEKLIDEIWLYLMPIILSSGLDLFEGLAPQTTLKLKSSRSFPSGVLELIYKPSFNP